MTHMPSHFRVPTVLIQEWRKRASESRLTNAAAAEVYERCAAELETLDVHTETMAENPRRWWRPASRTEAIPLPLVMAVGAVLMAAGFAALRSSDSTEVPPQRYRTM